MGVGDMSAGLVLLVGGVVGHAEDRLNKEESEEDGAEDCMGATIGFVQLKAKKLVTSFALHRKDKRGLGNVPDQ